MALQGQQAAAASQLQGLQFQGAAGQQAAQLAGAQALQNQQITGAQNLQNQQLAGAQQAQSLGVAQQNLMAQGQGNIDMAMAEGAAGVQAAQFGQLGTVLGMEMGTMAGLQGALQGAYTNQLASYGASVDMFGAQAEGAYGWKDFGNNLSNMFS